MDYSDAVTRLCVLDIVPTHTVFRDAGRELAAAYWHWFFFQVPDLPEIMLGAVPEAFLRYMFRALTSRAGAIEEPMIQEYLRAFTLPGTIRAGLEDYRAAATRDFEDDERDLEKKRALSGAGDLGRVRQDAQAVRRVGDMAREGRSTCAGARCPAATSSRKRRRRSCWPSCEPFSSASRRARTARSQPCKVISSPPWRPCRRPEPSYRMGGFVEDPVCLLAVLLLPVAAVRARTRRRSRRSPKSSRAPTSSIPRS